MTNYEEGRLAYLQGDHLDENLYPVGTVEAAAWEMGFKDCAAGRPVEAEVTPQKKYQFVSWFPEWVGFSFFRPIRALTFIYD